MTDHSITPPPELVQQWIGDYYGCPVSGELSGVETAIAARAAQWGADQELEACCEWLCTGYADIASRLRTARRPKPPSLKEQAMRVLVENGTYLDGRMELDPADIETIRRALEALPND